jgi:tetratricopeptide (TPR) repeat protein
MILLNEAETIRRYVHPALQLSKWADRYLKEKEIIKMVHTDRGVHTLKKLIIPDFSFDIGFGPLAIVEVKSVSKGPYGAVKDVIRKGEQLLIPVGYSTNGIEIVEYDFLAKTLKQCDKLPTPAQLLVRFWDFYHKRILAFLSEDTQIKRIESELSYILDGCDDFKVQCLKEIRLYSYPFSRYRSITDSINCDNFNYQLEWDRKLAMVNYSDQLFEAERHFKEGRFFQAKEIFDKIFDDDRRVVYPAFGSVACLNNFGLFEEAFKLADETIYCLDWINQRRAIVVLVDEFLFWRQYSIAQQCLDLFIALDDQNVHALELWGYIHFCRRQYEEAISAFQSIPEIERNEETSFNLALSHCYLGELGQGIKIFYDLFTKNSQLKEAYLNVFCSSSYQSKNHIISR